MPVVKLTADGKLPLPDEIRVRFGLRPGDSVTIEPTASGILITPHVASPKAASLPASSLQESINRKNLATPMQFIKGVGPKLAEALSRKGIATVEDALYQLPNRYEDRRQLTKVAKLRPGTREVFFA